MKMKYYFIVAAIALLAVFVAVPVGAKGEKGDLNRLVSGDYAMNVSFVCAQAHLPYGFDPGLNRSATTPGSTVSGSSQGVVTYDGDGGLTFQGQVLGVTHDAGGGLDSWTSPVSQYDMACLGTYQVNKDLSFEGQYHCRLDPLAGPLTIYGPDFYMEIKGLRLKGQLLGTMGNILQVRSDTEPNVEEIYFVFAPDSDPVQVAERICTNNGTAMKIVGKGN